MAGDELLALIGLPVQAPRIQAALLALARGMQPELDPEDDNAFVDWVTVNEIGLEFGFEDRAYVMGLDMEPPRTGPLLLTQLYFYGDTPKTRPFPHPLPLGLDFGDDRGAVRAKLAAHEASRRSYLRDAWRLDAFELTAAYREDDGRLESLLCHVPYRRWPAQADERDLAAPFTPELLIGLFGARWSSAVMRRQLAPLGYESALSGVRMHRSADLHVAHGIEFGFAPGELVAGADLRYPRSLALASVTYYGARVLDARQWMGAMPFDLSFDDSQAQIAAKLGRAPDERTDFDRSGLALWHFEGCSLRVEYSNIENHLLRVTLMAPGYWLATGAGLEDAGE